MKHCLANCLYASAVRPIEPVPAGLRRSSRAVVRLSQSLLQAVDENPVSAHGLPASGGLESSAVFNTMWKMPARLWRERDADAGAGHVSDRREIAQGPLEEMVKLAADVDEDEGQLLSIDCVGTQKPLAWPEIRALRRAPTFPIEI